MSALAILASGLAAAQQQQQGSPQFEQATYSGEEGDTVVLTVTRTGGSDGRLFAFYESRDTGSASAELDYSPVSGQLVWEDGDTSSREISVPLFADDTNENDETFAMDVFSGEILQDTSTVTIIDPQPDPVQAQDDQAYTPPGTSVIIPVVENDVGEDLTVRDIVSQPENGSAFRGEDPRVIFYDPGEEFTGIDTFVYSVADLAGNVDTANVTVVVGLDSIEDLDPNERSVGTALEEVCATVEEGPLAERCSELRQLGPSEIEMALHEIAPEKAAAQGSSLVEVSNAQIGNIRARLAALRAGAAGMSVAGLSVGVGRDSVPIGAIAHGSGDGSRSTWGPSTAVGNSMSYGSWGSASPSPNDAGMGPVGGYGSNASLGGIAPSSAQVETDTPETGGDMLREESRLGIFLNGRAEFGDKDSTTNEVGFDFNTQGLTFGVDYRFNRNFVWGGSLGYSNTDSEFYESGGELETETFTLATYGNYYPAQRSYIDWIVSYGTTDFDMRRNIVFGPVDTTAVSQTDGEHWTASVSSGMDFRHKGLMFGPLVRADYLNADIDGFVEEGGSGLGLAIDEQSVESFTGAVGGQASMTLSRSWGILTPGVRLEWEHEFLDDERLMTARFASAPGSPFVIGTDDPDRDYFNFGVNLAALFRGGTTAFIDYERVLAQDTIERNILNFGVRWQF